MLLLVLALIARSTASRRGLAAVPAGAQVRSEDRYYYTTQNGITLANTTSVANPQPSPVEAPALSPTALLVASELGFTGQWNTFSLDSGVIAIHSTLTSDNYVLFMERPGNRETPVGSQLLLQILSRCMPGDPTPHLGGLTAIWHERHVAQDSGP